uniref:Uncharacterized protein n=1 Tax=Tanacetum cinerariifolium TaxID=118510 RepID=A0A6L2MMI4_TANCI|nr:hypothetical protein [Tanacetum cinerariifolium]
MAFLSTVASRFPPSTINPECSPIPEIRKPFKMEESQLNKFMEDKLKVLLALEIEEFIQPQGETMQLVKQREVDTIPQNSAFHTEDLDAYDLDCDDISSAKVVMMENLSSFDSDVLSEVPYSDTYLNDMINQEKDQFDSIRKTRVQSKEHCASLIAQINAKSIENSNLNAQLQEKVFAIAALKNELRKLKGKNVVDTVVSRPSATIDPGMFKLDMEPISHRLKNNRDAHEVYLKKAIENTDTLRGLVECARKQNPIAVTPMNKDKRLRFAEPVTSSRNIPKQTGSLRTKYSNKPLLIST